MVTASGRECGPVTRHREHGFQTHNKEDLVDAVILTQYRRVLDELACRMSHPGSWAGIPRLLDQLYRLRCEHELRTESASVG